MSPGGSAQSAASCKPTAAHLVDLVRRIVLQVLLQPGQHILRSWCVPQAHRHTARGGDELRADMRVRVCVVHALTLCIYQPTLGTHTVQPLLALDSRQQAGAKESRTMRSRRCGGRFLLFFAKSPSIMTVSCTLAVTTSTVCVAK